VISSDEAFLLFRKWVSEHTSVRVDGKSSLYSFSLTGTLAPAESEIICLQLGDSGYIEFHLPPGTGFDYFDPDTMRAPHDVRIGRGYKGESIVYGAGIVAMKESGERFQFMELANGSPSQ